MWVNYVNLSDSSETKAEKLTDKLTEDDENNDIDDEETKAIIDDEEDEDMEFTKEELEEYMNKPYAELMKEFREGIGEMTDDPAELARLNALAEQLESSYENLEAMDDVINDVSLEG